MWVSFLLKLWRRYSHFLKSSMLMRHLKKKKGPSKKVRLNKKDRQTCITLLGDKVLCWSCQISPPAEYRTDENKADSSLNTSLLTYALACLTFMSVSSCDTSNLSCTTPFWSLLHPLCTFWLENKMIVSSNLVRCWSKLPAWCVFVLSCNKATGQEGISLQSFLLLSQLCPWPLKINST